MIPKIIHYCWFGEETIPKDYQQYIDAWKKINPDYEIMLWNESNSPMDLKYLKTAKKNKKWANMSNLVRFHALYNHGGVYLDTDVQLIKPLDALLENECFLGFEQEDDTNGLIVNNAVLGAKKKNKFIEECLKYISAHYDGTESADLSAPVMVTSILKENYGLLNKGYQVLNSSITVYPTDFFYPIHVHKSFQLANWKDHITENTFCIHMWGRSWLTIEEAKKSIDWLNKCQLEKEAKLKENVEEYTLLRKTADEIWTSKLHFEKLYNEQIAEIARLQEIIDEDSGNYFSEIKNVQKNHNDELTESIKDLLIQELRHLKNENGIYFRRKLLKEELDQKKQQLLFLQKENEKLKLLLEEKISETTLLQNNSINQEITLKSLERDQQKHIQENDLLKKDTIEKQALIASLNDKLKNEAKEKQTVIDSLSDKSKKETLEKQSTIDSLTDKLKKETVEKQAIDTLANKLKNEVVEKQSAINSLSEKIKEQSALIDQYENQLSKIGFFDIIRKKLNLKND